jgi:hypothetical protein
MRLPNVRGAIMGASHPRQLELFEAYEFALECREIMRFNPSEQDLFDDYAKACLDIERDVCRAVSDARLSARMLRARLDDPKRTL